MLHKFLSKFTAFFIYLDPLSASSSAELMPSFFSSSTRSPFWCICSRMSQPPTNSPLKYTWGMVGQLEKSLTPARWQKARVRV